MRRLVLFCTLAVLLSAVPVAAQYNLRQLQGRIGVPISIDPGGSSGGEIVGPAFDSGAVRPHYTGPGSETTGGSGGNAANTTIYFVNTTSAATGSATRVTTGNCAPIECYRSTLKYAATVAGRRYVICETTGIFNLGGEVVVDDPNMTLDCAPAPTCGEGSGTACDGDTTASVWMTNTRFRLYSSNHIIRHIGIVRFADENNYMVMIGENDASVSISRIVLEHLSIGWNMLQCSTAFRPHATEKIAIYDVLFFEALSRSAANDGGYGLCLERGINSMGVMGPCSNTVQRSAFTSIWGRVPVFSVDCETSLFNSIAHGGYDPSLCGPGNGFNFGVPSFTYRPFVSNGPGDHHWLYNVVIPGPGSHADGGPDASFSISVNKASLSAGVSFYQLGNVGTGITAPSGNGLWTGTKACGYDAGDVNVATVSSVRVNTPTASLAQYASQWWTDNVKAKVLLNVGQRPVGGRTTVEQRVIGEIDAENAGDNTQTVAASNVMPDVAERWHDLTTQIPSNPFGVGSSAGRNRLDDWLDAMAKRVESSQGAN